MKIIATDNLARETIADRLVASGLDQKTGEIMLTSLNMGTNNNSVWRYQLVEDDYGLSKGMEDLV